MRYFQRLAFSCTLLPVAAVAALGQADFDLPSHPDKNSQKLTLWATHYFVHQANPMPSGLPFKDKSGKALSDKVAPRDWCLGAIEGTIQVHFQSGVRTLNYGGTGASSQIDCAAVLKINPIKKPWITLTGKSYFAAAVGPFGDGVQGYRLIPYRTIAVDKSVIPFGTVIFVAKAKGATFKLPSGTVAKHDGYFFAGDTGGAIKKNHIDVFCGTISENCFPDLITSDETRTFEAIRVEDPAIVSALQSLHKQ